MTAEETTRFQKLHRQVATNQTLTTSDRKFYEETLEQLNTEETAQFRRYEEGLTTKINALEEELSQLQQRRTELKAQLKSLETAQAA